MAIKHIQTSHLVHDLKNPSNIIETGARALLEKKDRYGPLSPKQERVIRRMLRSALKVKNLANCMLEVDMATRGIKRVRDCTMSDVLKTALIEVFDLVDPTVSDALESAEDLEVFRRVLGEHQIYLDADDKEISRAIRIDETKLSLVITNLLSNALKYKEKSIFLKCSSQGNSVNVSVKDDGPGIPESYHEQIFDQYFQCVEVEGFPVRGHGLGLAGALALTQALGGRLYLCKSDHGAEFVVEVTLSDETSM
ncbi:MAG: HAMP domain-containing sensor histidine kinase [Deltaproteobacteria bacterium]